MVRLKISKKYTDDFGRLQGRQFKVCDRCATINMNSKRRCIKCGSVEFSPLSRYEMDLLITKPELRD
ncbi:MAG: hypothetical protein FIB08_08760 [Candidatus Methanoperedens sp.]|nr:hypothetical protein [Candidatus Methanoperedens sp.]